MRCKTKSATPLRYEVLNKDTLKSKFSPICMLQTVTRVQKSNIFSRKFNAMSANFVPNRPTCRKKSILAKVCFDAKKGQHANATK